MDNRQTIQSEIAKLGSEQSWNHNIELDGVWTNPGEQKSHGKNLIKWARIEPILKKIDLNGKRVLDIGCNEGFFSFKLAELGAQVQGIDIDEKRIKKAVFSNSILKYSGVNFRVVDIYSKEFMDLEKFDFCLCMGFLHRIPDPFTAVSRLVGKSSLILFEWKALKHGPHDESFAYYTPGDFDRKDYYGTQFWLLSFKCVQNMLKRVGFSYFHKIDDPAYKRAIMVAGSVKNSLFLEADKVSRGNPFLSFLRHTKSYIKTIGKILTGTINA